MDLKKIEVIFVRQQLPAKTEKSTFRFISLRFHVYNNLARFSDYLASFLVSAHLEVFQKERKNGPSIRTTKGLAMA